MLAEAGLLDGRRAGCHWAYRDLFREHYPRVELAEDSILNLTSESEGVITAGGVTAWQDLALHLIARLCGPAHALQTSKVFLLAGHEDGQRPFAAMTRPKQARDAVIGQCQAWIARALRLRQPGGGHDGAIGSQAAHVRASLPVRRPATGRSSTCTPLRIEEARRIIETDARAIDDVGYRWATRTRPSSDDCSSARRV